MKTIGKNIKKLRKKNGLSQEKFAEKINAVRQSVSKWERGESSPTLENIEIICREFNVTPEDLMGKNDTKFERLIDRIDKKKLESVFTIIITTILILFISITMIKFFIMKYLINEISNYCNNDNYYFETSTYENNILTENKKIWYLNGVYKITECKYSDTGELYTQTNKYIDTINKKFLSLNNLNNETINNNNENIFINYKKGYIETLIPQELIDNQSSKEIFLKSMKHKIYNKGDSWNISKGKTNIIIENKEDLTIIEQDNNNKYNFKQKNYLIKQNTVTEDDIKKESPTS